MACRSSSSSRLSAVCNSTLHDAVTVGRAFRLGMFGLSSSDTDEWWQERENEEGNGNRWSTWPCPAAGVWWGSAGQTEAGATNELETADAGEACHTSSSVLM